MISLAQINKSGTFNKDNCMRRVRTRQGDYIAKCPQFGESRFELFYHLLDNFFGFGVTLPTELVSKYVVTPYIRPLKPALPPITNLAMIYYLDLITGNWDRHSGNLINNYAIDHECLNFEEMDCRSYNNLKVRLEKCGVGSIILSPTTKRKRDRLLTFKSGKLVSLLKPMEWAVFVLRTQKIGDVITLKKKGVDLII